MKDFLASAWLYEYLCGAGSLAARSFEGEWKLALPYKRDRDALTTLGWPDTLISCESGHGSRILALPDNFRHAS